MTKSVVEVGPGTIRGSGEVPVSLVSIALECIDDDIALLDEQPVAVATVWREVFRFAIPGDVDDVVLVCPTWWPTPRLDRVREAAEVRCVNNVVLRRSHVLAGDLPGTPAVVEIGDEFVTVSRDGSVVAAESRVGDDTDVARSLRKAIGTASTALVDAPAGITGGAELARAIAVQLRADDIAVTAIHPDRVLAGRKRSPVPRPLDIGSPRRGLPKAMALAAVTSVMLLTMGLGVKSANGPQGGGTPMTLLVEGHVAVQVPALWGVRRIASGSGAGSARLQVTAPDDSAAVLITQSRVRTGETLAETAASLRNALDGEHADVFTAFNPNDNRAGRPAVTYRELRAGREVDWAVFADGGARIGVGCQSTVGAHVAARYACEQAIRSAHAAF